MNLSFRLFKYFSQKNHSKILLSLEGNIGAGKTTFLRLLNDDLKIPFEIVPEPVNDWQQFGKENNKVNLLDLFYKDPKKYGYIFQSFCFYSRLKNWSQNVNSFKKNLLIFERSVYSDKHIFAINSYKNGFFNEVEWEMYNEWYEFLVNNLSNPLHGIIYLQTTPEMCLKRTQKRGRTGEDKISIDYLRQLHCLHEEWLGNEEKKKEMKVLRLNTNEEFEENETNKKELIFKTKCFINDIAFNKE